MHLREKCLAGCRMRYGVVFFGLDRQLVRVTLHGKIHSRDRGSRISFDVVVEVSRKGASGPFLYWLWECKDYTRPIQVNESLGAQVPKGRLKPCAIRQPSLRDLSCCGRWFPTLKRWAIIVCPSGTVTWPGFAGLLWEQILAALDRNVRAPPRYH